MKLYYVEGSQGVRYFTYTASPQDRARIRLHFHSKGWANNPFIHDEGDFSSTDCPAMTLRTAGQLMKAINGPIRFARAPASQ